MVDGIDVLGVKAPSPTILTLPFPGTDVPIRPVILGPNITGTIVDIYNGRASSGREALKISNISNGIADGDYGSHGQIYLDASWCNSIYKNSAVVQPSALILNYIIKY